MAEEQLESGQEATESKAPPVPEISEPSGDERPSAAAVDTDSLAKTVAAQVLELLDGTIDRKLQSTKDKRLSVLDGLDVASLKRFAALTKELGSEDKAIRELAIDRLIERQSSPVSDPGRSPKVETRDTSVILAEVKNDLGVEIAPDDPDLQAAGKKTYGSWDSWKTEIYKIGARKVKQANSTPVVAETPQRAPSGGTIDSAQEKLARLQADPKAKTADLESASKELREALNRQR